MSKSNRQTLDWILGGVLFIGTCVLTGFIASKKKSSSRDVYIKRQREYLGVTERTASHVDLHLVAGIKAGLANMGPVREQDYQKFSNHLGINN